MDDILVVVIVLALLAEIAYSVWCAWRMRQRYSRRLIESYLWDRLIDAQIRTVVAGLIVAIIAIWTLGAVALGWPAIPRPWGAIALVAALALLFWGPISDWRVVRAIEDGHADD